MVSALAPVSASVAAKNAEALSALPDGFISDTAHSLLSMAQQNPLWLFAAIAILPGFGFPSSPLFILAGIVWGTTVEGCAIACSALILNLAWTHQMAAHPGHKILTRWFGEKAEKWGQFGKERPLKMTTLVRITPGIPLCVQNYTLGVMRVPFVPYILLSSILTSIFACGLVVAGGAFLNGNLTYALAGVAAIIALNMIFKSLRHRIGSVPTR
jgi:uncharacterized membrane protein YdjX (TVP38/TMEM64 family)